MPALRPPITPLILAALVALAAPAPLCAAPPLTDSQQARLETADDGSTTPDEAAFYALLENVADAPLTKAGATIPDYATLRADPAAHRGQLFYIEGRLFTAQPPVELAREGYEQVRPFVVQIDGFGKAWAELTADDIAYVYLTDPPAVTVPTLRQNEYMLNETGSEIKLTARFYKLIGDANREGEQRTYLAFVGHSADLAPGKGTLDPTVRNTVIFSIAIGAMLIYWFWRLSGIRKRRASRESQVQEYLRQREERRRERGDFIDDDDPDLADLPEDPIEAMEALRQRRAATADPPAFTLDDGETPQGGNDQENAQ